MPAQSYGGYVWSNEPAPEYNSNFSMAGSLAVAAGVGLGAFGLSTATLESGHRPIDYVAAATRTAGNLSPFQLGNTFRIPELLSPFTSIPYKSDPDSLAATGAGWSGQSYSWDSSYLKSDSTYDWLKYSTGLSDKDLQAAGVTRGMTGDGDLATQLVWEKTPNSLSSGSLFAIRGTDKTLLSKDVSLMAMNSEVTDVLSGKVGLNRIAASQFAAADMWSNQGFSAEGVLTKELEGKTQRAGFMFMPSMTGRLTSVDDFRRRTNFMRSIPAFEMDRFNRLLVGAAEQFGGETGKKFFNNVLGMTPGVLPGPASAQFLRFGGKAAMFGGAAIGMSQLDWVRRNYGPPGQALASTAVSAGVSWAAFRMGASPHKALAAGAATFFGQTVLPGFDQGVLQGIASTAVTADIYLRANPLNPFAHMRRLVEGFAPGFSGWETGALGAIGAVGLSALRIPGVGRAPVEIAKRFGFVEADDVAAATQNVRDAYYKRLAHSIGGHPDSASMYGRREIEYLVHTTKFDGDSLQTSKFFNQTWASAENEVREIAKDNPINKALVSRLEQVNAQHAGAEGMGWLAKQAKGLGYQALYSFFGADVTANKQVAEQILDMGFTGPTGRMGRMATIGALAFGTHQLLFGGALGSMEDWNELSDIYSGKKLVEVKSGRWWEAGGTQFEGSGTSYFRPHAYHLFMSRTREAGTWKDGDSRSPIRKFLEKNFTYNLEREQYYDRPYPISSAAFSDVPIIGGLLSSTIGKLIKPPRLMHVGEWARQGAGGQMEYASVFRGSRAEPAYSLGAPTPGIPQSPFNTAETLAFASYQFRELEGMTGWAKNVVQNLVAGSELWNTDTPVLAQAGEMTSWRTRFWEAQMGGMFFTNELVRRILPRQPHEKRSVNPILNSMPSWLPDKFHYGDPYRAVEWGEARLPGNGFASLHPELKGIDPEDYPLIYQYGILGDVAPNSREFRMMKEVVYQQRYQGAFSAREIDYIDAVDARHARVMNKYNFEQVDPNAYRPPGSGTIASMYLGAQGLLREAVAPAEYLVPMGFRPFQKLMGNRDPVEQYEYERMYGTPMAFWDKPIRDWLRPSMYSAMHFMGYDAKPLWRREADAVGEYFDKVEYLKQMQLAEQAQAAGDGRAAFRHKWAASQTRTGVNPMGNPLSIYWSLPAEERKFFNTFAHAQGPDRARIREMVPSDHVNLYEAVWSRMDQGDPGLWAGSPTAVDDQYLAAQMSGASQYMAGQPTPAEDWIGWHADVDMDDIKVRYVNNMGRDLHDFGLWESQLKKSMGQPFLDESDAYIHQQGGIAPSAVRSDLYNMLGRSGQGPYLQVTPHGGARGSANFTYNDDRHNQILGMVQRELNGY